MITLPANFATNVASSTSSFIGELSPYLTLILGVLLSGLLLTIIISSLHSR